jgi:DNA-binding GntR family transcriptional regulator
MAPHRNDEAAPRPLNEPTYARIKQAIIADLLRSNFPPGTQITIEMLKARYKVSHMPIREALRQLEGEGVLVSTAHKGFRVEEITGDYIRRIYDIRAAIEAILARRAVERMTDDELAGLLDHHRRLLVDMNSVDRALASLTNIAFHRRLYAIAGNPEAEQLLDGRTLVVRTFSLSFGGYRNDDRPRVVIEHERIIAAIEARDAEGASRAVFDHVEGARDRLLDRIERLKHAAP